MPAWTHPDIDLLADVFDRWSELQGRSLLMAPLGCCLPFHSFNAHILSSWRLQLLTDTAALVNTLNKSAAVCGRISHSIFMSVCLFLCSPVCQLAFLWHFLSVLSLRARLQSVSPPPISSVPPSCLLDNLSFCLMSLTVLDFLCTWLSLCSSHRQPVCLPVHLPPLHYWSLPCAFPPQSPALPLNLHNLSLSQLGSESLQWKDKKHKWFLLLLCTFTVSRIRKKQTKKTKHLKRARKRFFSQLRWLFFFSNFGISISLFQNVCENREMETQPQTPISACCFIYSQPSLAPSRNVEPCERGRAMISLALGKTYGGLSGKKLLSLSLQAISCLESKVNITVTLRYSNSGRSLCINTVVFLLVCFFILYHVFAWN